MDISGDVKLVVVYEEEGSACGHSVCMRNVGMKKIYIHRNQHGSRSKCVCVTPKIAKMLLLLLSYHRRLRMILRSARAARGRRSG